MKNVTIRYKTLSTGVKIKEQVLVLIEAMEIATNIKY